eukprot:427059-Prorocentrum_minimum.AAC.1
MGMIGGGCTSSTSDGGGGTGGNLHLEARVEGLAEKSTQTTRYYGTEGEGVGRGSGWDISVKSRRP